MPFTASSALHISRGQTKPPALVFPKPEPKSKPGRNAAAVNVERSRARGRVASNTLTALGGGSGQLTHRHLPIHGSSSHLSARHSVATVMMMSSANSRFESRSVILVLSFTLLTTVRAGVNWWPLLGHAMSVSMFTFPIGLAVGGEQRRAYRPGSAQPRTGRRCRCQISEAGALLACRLPFRKRHDGNGPASVSTSECVFNVRAV